MSQSGLVTEEQSTESCGNATAAISGGRAASREGQPQPALPQVRCQGTRPPAATRADTTGESVTEVCGHRLGRDWTTTSPPCSEKESLPSQAATATGKPLDNSLTHPSFLPSLLPHTAHAVLPAQRGSAQPSHLSCSTFNGAARQQSVGN